MQHKTLHAPWRIDYIRTIDRAPPGSCFLCDASQPLDAGQRRGRLVLWQSALSVVLINRFPYTNGHLLIAPRNHKAELEELSEQELLDMQVQTVRAIHMLRQAISPQGFNVGINLGRCAGAGLPGHVHQHVVPRWSGDTNFMSVVGDVRIVPQATEQLYDELERQLAEIDRAGAAS